MSRGNFFAVDRIAFNRVCDLGVNAAVVYLILARGTGGDQRTTSWSVHAIETRTAISRQRAALAIKKLIDAGMLSQTKDGKRPQYRIEPASDNRKGARRGSSSELAPPDWIWLPNSIVDGLATETPPLEMLRQSQNSFAIRLLVNLYHEQDLRDDGGINWRPGVGLREEYDQERLFEYGRHVIWGFTQRQDMTWWTTPYCVAHKNASSAKEKALTAEWWETVRVLTHTGLLEFVPHLIDADTIDGEVIHPLPVRGNCGEQVERRLGKAAYDAAVAMLPERLRDSSHCCLVPVLAHMVNVSVVGIARLRYRPRTAATESWLAHLGQLQRLVQHYEALTANPTAPMQRIA